MYEQENQRATHLIILMVYTLLTIALTGETFLLGWEKEVAALLVIGLIVSWILHITEKIPEAIRLWIYFVLAMLTFFFYGIHKTSIYDLTPLMIVIILLFFMIEKYSMIKFCIAVYFATLGYDIIFVTGNFLKFNALTVSRTVFHIVLICLSGYLVKIGLRRRERERVHTNNKIVRLEETNRRAEDFLANVSHELRTPINAVTGLTAVMLKKEENAEKRKDILSMQAAGNRLFEQIEDILDYTEVDTGKIKVTKDPYMISSVVNDIISQLSLQEKEKMPEIVIDMDAGIPAVLLGDAKKIKKILKHLIDNAIKFTPKGGIYVKISALMKPYGINLGIRVSDTGVGIAKEELGRIMDRFYQSSGGSNRKVGGLGLGLSIVYGMVHAMNGFMQIKSTQGVGTTVSISIPQKVVDDTPSMMVVNRRNLCLASFFSLEEVEVPEIRNYYDQAISHMIRDLDLTLHRIANMEELHGLILRNQLTHLFIGENEYKGNPSYFEELPLSVKVIMLVGRDFIVPKGSRIKILRKPLFCPQIVRILNAGILGDMDTPQEKHMICPGVRVLVVDDEPMNRIVAEGIFKTYQMIVKTAESGAKAIALCENDAFDLVFLDHMMPEMDGVETLKKLRRIYEDQRREVKVIAFTANVVSGAREMFLKEGFDDFVSKPIETVELERVLRKVLPKSSIAFVEEEGKKNAHEEKPMIPMERMANEPVFNCDSKEDKRKCLESVGIHIDTGMHYCGGDRELYKEVLTDFAGNAENKIKEIQTCFEQEDLENYCILVHALKSVAKTIGAASLSEHARQAEEASRNYDVDYVQKHNEELLLEYHHVVQSIVTVLDLKLENRIEDDWTEGTRVTMERGEE